MDVLKEQGPAFRGVLCAAGLFLVGWRQQLQRRDQAAVGLVEDLEVAFARPFEDGQGDRDRLQRRQCGRAGRAFRSRTEPFAVADRDVRKAELARLRVMLDEVDALAQGGLVLRRQSVGDGFAPRIDESRMEVRPIGWILQVRVHTGKRGFHGSLLASLHRAKHLLETTASFAGGLAQLVLTRVSLLEAAPAGGGVLRQDVPAVAWKQGGTRGYN